MLVLTNIEEAKTAYELLVYLMIRCVTNMFSVLLKTDAADVKHKQRE